MYSLPQEIEVWYIIPAIRKKLAVLLSKEYKLKQKEIARILGITDAAVSQYISKKRANGMNFPKEMDADFEKSCKKIVKDNKTVVKEILRLVSLSKENGVSCCMCRKHNKGILAICSCKPSNEQK
jgi:uncharacterized protein